MYYNDISMLYIISKLFSPIKLHVNLINVDGKNKTLAVILSFQSLQGSVET